MNDYKELRININPCNEIITDVLAQFLGEIGYESFVPDENGLTSYIKNELFCDEKVNNILDSLPFQDISYAVSSKFVEGRDWNSEWEKNYFQPIVVDNKCVIHSSFHKGYPKCEFDIVIDPKMAFGTGHHQTTSLIIKKLLSLDLRDLSMVDMGTGTGILAILAAMKGAKKITAIEIDPMAHINAVENVSLNGHPEIEVLLGDASLLKNITPVDLFVANINRNIITNDLKYYVGTMKSGATILLSGFYVEDISVVVKFAIPLGLEQVGYSEMDNWACLQLKKI